MVKNGNSGEQFFWPTFFGPPMPTMDAPWHAHSKFILGLQFNGYKLGFFADTFDALWHGYTPRGENIMVTNNFLKFKLTGVWQKNMLSSFVLWVLCFWYHQLHIPAGPHAKFQSNRTKTLVFITIWLYLQFQFWIFEKNIFHAENFKYGPWGHILHK